MFLEARKIVRDTWHILSGSGGATCSVQNESNMSSSGAMRDTWHYAIGRKSMVDG